MKKILVTGATGFIGNYVIGLLLQKNYAVIATSNSLEKARKYDWYDRVEYTPLDLHKISKEVNYYRLLGEPDLLLHLAWEGLPNYKSAFHIEENLPHHIHFLENMVQNGLKDITVTGTCFEYGMQEGRLTEDMPAMPSNAYAVAKDRLRQFLTGLQEKNHFLQKWARLFYMYGEGQNPNSLLSQLQAAIDRGEKVFNMSPGDQLRDYLPVEKMAEYIVAIATQTKVTGIINCCSGSPIPVKKLVEDYLKEKKVSISLNTGFYSYPDIEPKHFWGDTRKLDSIINQ